MRLFLALDLPETTRAELLGWRQRALAGRDDLRPLAPEALHVTLVFLGYLPEKKLEQTVTAAFEGIRDLSAPRLAVRDVRAVPPRDPRLFAFDLSDEGGDATTLQAAASQALAAARLCRPEKRPFWPHVTFARVKRGQRRVPPVPGDDLPQTPFAAAQVTLYRSHLSPRGARYEPLERVKLAQ